AIAPPLDVQLDELSFFDQRDAGFGPVGVDDQEISRHFSQALCKKLRAGSNSPTKMSERQEARERNPTLSYHVRWRRTSVSRREQGGGTWVAKRFGRFDDFGSAQALDSLRPPRQEQLT